MPFVLPFALRANSRAGRLLRSRRGTGPFGCCADPAGRGVFLSGAWGRLPFGIPSTRLSAGSSPAGHPCSAGPLPLLAATQQAGTPRGPPGAATSLRSDHAAPCRPRVPRSVGGEGMGALPPIVRPRLGPLSPRGLIRTTAPPGERFLDRWRSRKDPRRRTCGSASGPLRALALHSDERRGLRRRGSAGPIGSCRWLPLRPVGLRTGWRWFCHQRPDLRGRPGRRGAVGGALW